MLADTNNHECTVNTNIDQNTRSALLDKLLLHIELIVWSSKEVSLFFLLFVSTARFADQGNSVCFFLHSYTAEMVPIEANFTLNHITIAFWQTTAVGFEDTFYVNA